MKDDHIPLSSCPVCRSNQSSLYLAYDSINLRQCADCKLVWWTTPPERQAIKLYFQNEYITDEQRLTVKFIDYRADAIAMIATKIAQAVNAHSSRLLDVGTASGSFLEAIHSHGFQDISGVEPSSFAAESVRERLGFKVHAGFIEDQHFEDESFNLVTCLDTLCLVSEPQVDVSEFARILAPGGRCFIELPGFNYRMLKGTGFIGRLLYGKKPGIQLGVHTLYFRRQSLTRLFEQHGLKLHQTTPIPGPIYGAPLSSAIKRLLFSLIGKGYTLSRGHLNLAPKILYEFRKPL